MRILARSDPADLLWRDLALQVVPGDLGDSSALRRLVSDADAVVHLAGAIKATDTAGFMRVNCDGSRRVAEAVREHAPPASRFFQISSLAARAPQLSAYAASKRAGEDAVRAVLGERVTVLRPPAVYGPGDRETLVFFQLAKRNPVPLLGSVRARNALIHVEDLAAALAALVADVPRSGTYALADARPEGYGWLDIMRAAAQAVGNPAPRFWRLPRPVLAVAAAAGDLGRRLGRAEMLTSEKLRELLHEDWAVAATEMPSQLDWKPRFTLEAGFGTAVAWYRQQGWLK